MNNVKIAIIVANEIYNENLINCRIVKIDKYFNYCYYKVDKKIVNYTINNRIIVIHKFVNFDFNNFN